MGFFMLFPTLATAAGQPLFGAIGDALGAANGIRLAAGFPLVAVLLALTIITRTPKAPGLAKGERIYVGIAVSVVVLLSLPVAMVLSA
jgi:hypothetical protein